MSIADAAHLQSFQLGDAVVVQNVGSGQVWLLEGSQADDWPLQTLRPFPAPKVSSPDFSTPPSAEPALALLVALGDEAVEVRCWDPILARTFAGPLAPFVQDRSAFACRIDLYLGSEGPVVAVDGKVAHRPGSLGLGRWLALRQLACRLFPRHHWLALLHAASVALPFGAVLLAAASGSGKTTLAGALAAAGGVLLSDDITPIEAGSLRAWPYPLSMSVKEGSWQLFGTLFPNFRSCPPVSIGSTRVRYFQASIPLPELRGHEVTALVVPQYRHLAKLACVPLSPIDVLRSLVATGTWPPAAPEDLEQMLAWLQRLPAFRLTYGDVHEAVACIQDLR